MRVQDGLYGQNRLVARLLWFSLALAVGVTSISGIEQGDVLMIAVLGGLVCILVSLLTWRRVFMQGTKYIACLVVAAFAYALINALPYVENLFILCYALALVSLYHDKQPILLMTVIDFGLLNYFFFHFRETMFAEMGTTSLFTFNLYLALISSLIIVQTHLGERNRQALVQEQQALLAKGNIEQMLQATREAAKTLQQVAARVMDNVSGASAAAQQLSAAFQQVSSSSEQHSGSVEGISCSLGELDRSLQSVEQASGLVRSAAGVTTGNTESGSSSLQAMLTQVNQASRLTDEAVQLMQNLSNSTRSIGRVLDSINQIAVQTNLLALNAQIEAARAGEAGRGFAVVADQVRQLAEGARRDTGEVGEILQNIEQLVAAASRQVQLSGNAIGHSRESVQQVTGVFSSINRETAVVLQQAAALEQQVGVISGQSQSLHRETQAIAGLARRDAAAVAQVFAGIDQQAAQLNGIVTSYQELEQLIARLQQVSQLDAPQS